ALHHRSNPALWRPSSRCKVKRPVASWGNLPLTCFSQLDTDGDGQISKTEFEQALGAVGVDT
ncbi:MAG: EF-hand domain-containing protein, partial [Pseudolabrys sp.]